MRTIPKVMTIVVGTVVALLLVEVAIVGNLSAHLRPCGHPENLASRIQSLTGIHLENHDCLAMSMYNDIRAIDAGEVDYRRQHGSYSRTLSEVTNFLPAPLGYKLELTTGDQQWFAAVPAQDRFPGYYLFRGGPQMLRVYFSTNGPATTNDIVLCDPL